MNSSLSDAVYLCSLALDVIIVRAVISNK